MREPRFHRAFVASVVWTLILLFLGSVVHATESSLACPDWPTCRGTMVPVMSGGVFWEHLHRLVAGGLVLMWGLTTYLAWRDGAGPGVRAWSAAGMALLLVQAGFGGLTVIYRLPDAVSTTHLALALLFLVLGVVLAGATSPSRGTTASPPLSPWPGARGWLALAALVFAQSLLGGWVRHADAGTACGTSGLLCLDYTAIPPMSDPLAVLHFSHRALGVVAAVAVFATVVACLRRAREPRASGLALAAGALVLVQVGLGFASAWSGLAVAPVSLHTVVAALLLGVLVALATRGLAAAAPAASSRSHRREEAGAAA